MTPDNDQLTVLRRLQSEGRITDDEYQDLAKGFAPTDPELESRCTPRRKWWVMGIRTPNADSTTRWRTSRTMRNSLLGTPT